MDGGRIGRVAFLSWSTLHSFRVHNAITISHPLIVIYLKRDNDVEVPCGRVPVSALMQRRWYMFDMIDLTRGPWNARLEGSDEMSS